MSEPSSRAFGAPGIAPTWSSSDEDFVTAALDGTRLWATIALPKRTASGSPSWSRRALSSGRDAGVGARGQSGVI